MSLSLIGFEAMLFLPLRCVRKRKIQVVPFHLHIDSDKTFFLGEIRADESGRWEIPEKTKESDVVLVVRKIA